MTLNRQKWTLLLVPLLVFAFLVAACTAADDDAVPPREEPDFATTNTPEPAPTDEPAEEPEADLPTEDVIITNVVRASNLIGQTLTVPDADDIIPREVIRIEELLVDETGEIAYIILDTGGVLDPDAGLVAVDPDTISYVPGVPGTPVLAYSATVIEMEQSPAIDLAAIGPGAAIEDGDDVAATYYNLLRVSRLTNTNLLNPQGEDLGQVDDLLIDLDTGVVDYMVADFGGLLEAGENNVAIPWEQFSFSYEDEVFILPVDEETVTSAPLFDETVFGEFGAQVEDFDQAFEEFWESVTPAEAFDFDIGQTGEQTDDDEDIPVSATEIALFNTVLADNVLGRSVTILTEGGTQQESATIEDMLINEEGIIEYVVVDTGGLLDPDDPVFALPIDDFIYVPNETNNTRILTYTGDVTTLAEQPTIDLDAVGEGVAFPQDYQEPFNGLTRANFVISSDIDNDAGEVIAQIDDLVVNMDTGEVNYAIADFGGFLGVAEQEIAVPWGELTYAQEDERFTLPVTQEMLEEAPTFDIDWAPNGPADATWDDEYTTYWEDVLNS